MGALKKYDPKEVTITWRGISLNSGIVDGTFITISRTSRNSSMNTGTDGGSTMVINNDRTGVVALTLRAGSDTNDVLSDIVNLDEAGIGIKAVGPLEIRDFSGKSLHFDDEAFLDGPPDSEFANEESDNPWTFMCSNLRMNVRGSNAASETAG